MASHDNDGASAVLVTGANRSTGPAICRELDRRGYLAAALNRTPSGERRLHETICDQSSPDSVDTAVEEALSRFGRLPGAPLPSPPDGRSVTPDR